MIWSTGLRRQLKFDVALNGYTSFKIGGRARFFLEPEDIKQLSLAIKEARKFKIPIYILGKGSNLLVRDRAVKGLVIRLSKPFFKKIKFDHCGVEIGCATDIGVLVNMARLRGMSGCEFLAGIPGTIGGAIAMNAGAEGSAIGDLVEWVRVIDKNAKLKKIPKSKIKFGYRTSSLDKYVILSARLKLTPSRKKDIELLIRKYLSIRRKKQDYSFPSAGCVFKNPPGTSAGKLIDLCGLKGARIGGAQISLRHANFIVNRNKAKSGDVLSLMKMIRQKVKAKFGIELRPEIKIW